MPQTFKYSLHSRVFHYTEDGIDKRDYYSYVGVKIILRSDGTGSRFDLLITVLQVSSGLALLKLAGQISDFFMLNFYPDKEKRKAFALFKTEDSVDFSDKAYKIDYITFLRENQDEDEEEKEKNE